MSDHKQSRLIAGITLALLLVAVPTAFGSGVQQTTAPAARAEVMWHYPMINPDSLFARDDVAAAANELLEARANSIIVHRPIELAEYNQRMRTMAAAGERMDLVYTSWWTFGYFDMAPAGAFVALNDLLDQYAPTILGRYPEYIWQANTIDGRTYGVPHWENAAGPSGWVIQTELLEKYNFSIDSVQHYSDIEPLLARIKQGEPDLHPVVISRNGFWGEAHKTIGLEAIEGLGVGGIGLRRTDANPRPINLFDTPEFRAHTQTVRRWWNAGYFNPDAPLNPNAAELLNAGKFGTFFNRNLVSPDGRHAGIPVTYIRLGEGVLNSNAVLAHQTAVSRTSPHPDRAVQVLEVVHRDADVLQLLTYGIRDRHFELNELNQVRRIPDAGYGLPFDWMFGNVMLHGFRGAGSDPESQRYFDEALRTSKPSLALGFQFDRDPVSAQIAQVNAIMDEFNPQLTTGAEDPDRVLPIFLRRLDEAGFNRILDEVTRQYTAWLASR